MSETIEFTEIDEKNPVFDNARKVYLVSLGAASYTVSSSADFARNARTNVSDWTTKLIEQGEETDQKTRDAVNQRAENRQKELKNAQKRFEKEVSKRMESLLHAFNIPSQKDIANLNSKVTQLNKKVNELTKAQ